MGDARFIHLHLHTSHSLLASTVRLGAVIERAREWGMPALAMTDQGNLFAAIPFFTQCLKNGIQPIFGAQIYVTPDHADFSARPDRETRDQLILLARNPSGWRNLLRILSLGHLEGSHGKPRVDLAQLAPLASGLIALSAGPRGGVGRLLMAGKREEAAQLAGRLAEIFDDGVGAPNFYIELHRHNEPDEERLIADQVALAHELGLPLVASNDVHFLDPEDQPAQDALFCVGMGLTVYQEDRPRINNRRHFASPDEMIALFADLPEAIANTVQIARRCSVQLELGQPMLPDFQVPQGQTLSSWLRRLTEKGLRQRLDVEVLKRFAEEQHTQVEEQYHQRMEFELDVIEQMGFPGYFLIVSDFIRWAKDEGIPVGPGRGSGAGSLVAWSLEITDLDPIRYQLLFERFLNPERVSMPDFDVDFCMDNRERVIHYVQGRYGADRVAQIITFGTLQARMVIRDVGRVLEFPYGQVDRIAKLVPNILNISLNAALSQEPRLKEQMESDPEVRRLLELCLALEGLPRSAGTHAAGVVISNGPLTDTVPLYRDPRSEMPVTQFNMGDVEKAGLVKFDFLGLKTLTVIQGTLDLLNPARKARGEAEIDISQIDLEDPKAFELLKEGRTRGVFQLESSGMREILKKLAPDTLEEVIALVALYRPGPLGSGMVDDFINRKHGRIAVKYPLPQLEPILKETYGVILYQEQVMKIAQVLAGYSLGGADLLRRAMGKKKPEEMASQRVTFMEGAQRNGIAAEKAEFIFDLMEKFAGYGFNKSHSAAYALISYQTTWLKAHFPVAFLAATMTCDMHNTDKLVHFIRDCRPMGIEVFPPDVNRSEARFSVEGDGIRYGLAAVKNVGEGAVEGLLKARAEGGPFVSLLDFCRRVGAGGLNKRMLEQLIRAGAMDAFSDNRAALLAGLPAALSQGQREQEASALGFRDLFAEVEEEPGAASLDDALPEVAAPEPNDLLAFEKEALGFFLTGHPLESYAEEFAGFRLDDAETLRDKSQSMPAPSPASGGGRERERGPEVRMAGMVAERKILRTRPKGDPMAFLTFEDMLGQVELVVFPKTFELVRDKLDKDELLVISGSLEPSEEVPKVAVQEIFTLDEFRQKEARELAIEADAELLSDAALDRLESILTTHRGGPCRVRLHLRLPESRTTVGLGDAFRVLPSADLLAQVRGLFGPEAALFGPGG